MAIAFTVNFKFTCAFGGGTEQLEFGHVGDLIVQFGVGSTL